MSTETARPLKLDNLDDSLALVHGTLGYIPQQSLMIVGLAGGTSAAHLRIDLRPMLSSARDTTHQLVSWLVEDPEHAPDAIAVITFDQERAYTPEQMRSLTVHIEASFALVGVPIAVEHHLRGPHDAEALDQVLQNHPSLSAGSRTPTQEVQHWIETATVSSMTTERLEERIAPLATRTVELILSDDMPDWEAIVEVERQLHAALPPEGSRQRHTVLALKSLICHAQGKGSLATAFLKTADPEHPIVERVSRIAQTVHKFALIKEHSYDQWKRDQG